MALLRVVSRGNESLWNIILKEAKLSERDCKSLGKDCEKKSKKELNNYPDNLNWTKIIRWELLNAKFYEEGCYQKSTVFK